MDAVKQMEVLAALMGTATKECALAREPGDQSFHTVCMSFGCSAEHLRGLIESGRVPDADYQVDEVLFWRGDTMAAIYTALPAAEITGALLDRIKRKRPDNSA